MFTFRDFFHLPQLDPLIDQMVAEKSGLIVVAGMEARALELREAGMAAGGEGELELPIPGGRREEAFLPSGLATFFDILIQTILTADSAAQAVIVSREKDLARLPRQLKRRIKLLVVEGNQTYERQVAYALASRPALLVIDRLTAESAPVALEAARRGLKVISAFDTAQCGAGIVRQVMDLGVELRQLEGLHWVLTTRRLPVLCEFCREKLDFQPKHYERLKRRRPALLEVAHQVCFAPGGAGEPPALRPDVCFYRPTGCSRCRQSGRLGDVMLFDVFHPNGACLDEQGLPDPEAMLACDSLLSMEEYTLRLAARGMLAWDDVFDLEADLLRRTYHLLATSERALMETNATLHRKLFELEASNRVLLQRTEVLISLEDLGQALIASVSLNELASRVCRRAGELCGADRAILYLLRSSEAGERAEVLAARGWEGAEIQPVVEVGQIFGGPFERKIIRWVQLPPGVTPRPELLENEGAGHKIQAGLRVPLMAQEKRVGAMIIQSTQKGFFTPGETALLQTFANQAALAIQRAGLVDELRAKIIQLEQAQAELVQKERMERELELARQVQQSLLPSSFPEMSGFRVAARNEPARQVGGDFYDIIPLDEDHFGIVVADVADKGMPAALYMALSRSLLLAEAHRGLSPREVLLSVNRLLLELGELNGFVSVFYGVIERSTRRMRYTRAGHERPWLLRSAGPQVEIIQLQGSGAVLGILPEEVLNLSEEEVQLRSGDRLVLYSDGISDVADENGAFFGAERLAELLDDLRERPAEEIPQAVFEALARYRGTAAQFDDMTLMVVGIG